LRKGFTGNLSLGKEDEVGEAFSCERGVRNSNRGKISCEKWEENVKEKFEGQRFRKTEEK